MRIFSKIFLFTLVLFSAFFRPSAVLAVDYCYCELNLETATLDQMKSTSATVCKAMSNDACEKYATDLVGEGKVNFLCYPAASLKYCNAQKTSWQKDRSQKIKEAEAVAVQAEKDQAATQSQILPECVLKDKLDLQSKCGDITIFVELMIDIVNYLLGFVGGLALLFFIYGGFILILSGGSPDKITQGKEAMVSALIGLVVTFCGYALVSYLGAIVGISSKYILK